jgi:hypothetical protein
MAMLFGIAPRVLGLAARRETIAVGVATAAVIVAVAYGSATTGKPSVDQGWVGHLAATAPVDAPQPAPFSSSSLVVPKSALTLPPEAAKPVPKVKASCDSADRLCVLRPTVAAVAVPPHRQVAMVETPGLLLPPADIPPPSRVTAKTVSADRKGFSLNPLNHMPDMAAIGRPFSAAGTVVTGWIKWL